MLNQFGQHYLGLSRFESHDYSFKFSFDSTKNCFNKDCLVLSTISILKRIINKVRETKTDYLSEWNNREKLIHQFESMIRRIGALSKDEVLPLTFYEFYLNIQH
jgi:hypothetical protein